MNKKIETSCGAGALAQHSREFDSHSRKLNIYFCHSFALGASKTQRGVDLFHRMPPEPLKSTFCLSYYMRSTARSRKKITKKQYTYQNGFFRDI